MYTAPFQQAPTMTVQTRKTKQWELTEENRFGAHGMVQVYRANPQTVIKLTEPPRLTEAEALRFVRSKTSIPVPEVYDAYTDESIERGVIVMEYIEGDVLRDVWDGISDFEKDGIILQLRGYMEELRSIKGDFIGSVDQTSCQDPIFTGDLDSFGPYADDRALHEGIVRAVETSEEGPWVRQTAGFVRALPQNHEIVLTHSDFTPRNILVRGGRVVGIIDWEMAGFFPAYWEYVKALYYPNWENKWYSEDAVEKILPSYPLENAVMLQVQKIV